jgi:hypothetical protein
MEQHKLHELVLHKQAPGKTADDVIAFFHHPQRKPPFTNVGGMQALNTGLAGWVHLDLEPDTYIAICYIPDPATGKRHLEMGMVKTFIVKEQY